MYGTAQVTDGGSVDAQAARSPPYARLAFWGVDGLLFSGGQEVIRFRRSR